MDPPAADPPMTHLDAHRVRPAMRRATRIMVRFALWTLLCRVVEVAVFIAILAVKR